MIRHFDKREVVSNLRPYQSQVTTIFEQIQQRISF